MEERARMVDHLKRFFSPLVFVTASLDATEVAKKNSMEVVHLFKPFSDLRRLNATVRSIDDRAYMIRDFRVRFVHPDEIKPLPQEQIDKKLSDLVAQSAKTISMDQPPRIHDSAPWWEDFRQLFLESLRFSDHEFFDHPVGSVLVVSTRNPDPINTLVNLFNPNTTPGPLKDGVMDPNISKCYVLVHDNVDGPLDTADRVYADMKKTFGAAACYMLRINSAVPGKQTFDHQGLWREGMGDQAPAEGVEVGAALNSEDLTALQGFTTHYVTKVLLPHMEKKCAALHQQIGATRKGFIKQWKHWWKKQPRSNADDNSSPGVYPYECTESQIRQLADFSFMLQDYDEAMTNYRTVASDFKTDRAWKHYSGSQEMIALCLFMSDGNRRDMEASFDAAYHYYAEQNLHFATRATIFLCEAHNTQRDRKLKEAAFAFLRASLEESSLTSALLLEQAALCHLNMPKRQLRKYGFFMVLAGYHFNQCQQREHAWRCYSGALQVYQGKGWSHVDSHIYVTLGRQSAHLGRLGQSLPYYVKLFDGKQPPEKQSTLLKEFVYHYSQCDVKPLLEMPLPKFDDSVLTVIVNDDHLAAMSAATGEWDALEDDMKSSVAFEKTGKKPMALRSRGGHAAAPRVRACVVGEPILVEVSVTNPLQIPVEVTDLRLLCVQTEVAGDAAAGSSNTCATPAPPPGADPLSPEKKGDNHHQHDGHEELIEQLKTAGLLGDSATCPKHFEVDSKDVFLNPGQSHQISLRVRPLTQGCLEVRGAAWRIGGQVIGHHIFKPPQKKSVAKGRGKPTVHDPMEDLRVKVAGPMPLLTAQLHNFPRTLLQGQIHKSVLELTNFGGTGLKNLRLKLSDPAHGFVSIGKQDDVHSDLPDLRMRGSIAAPVPSGDSSVSFVSLPVDTLAPESTILLPMWVRVPLLGSQTFRFLFYYESEGENGHMNHRFMRRETQVVVQPSLGVGYSIHPSPTAVDEYVMAIEATNSLPIERVHLLQFSSFSTAWAITPFVKPQEASTGLPIRPSESLTLHFKISRGDEETDVRYDQEKTLLQPRVRPFVDFLGHEQALKPVFDSPARRMSGRFGHGGSSAGLGIGRNLPGFMSTKPTAKDAENIAELKAEMAMIDQRERLDMMVLWRIDQSPGQEQASADADGDKNGSIIFGQHSLLKVDIHGSVGAITGPSDGKTTGPVRVVLDLPEVVSHDFTSDSLCTVPVSAHIYNSSAYKSVTVEVCTDNSVSANGPETTTGGGGKGGGGFSPQVQRLDSATSVASSTARGEGVFADTYIWLGPTLHSLELGPLAKAVLPLQMGFVKAGVFCVDRFAAKVTYADDLREEVLTPFEKETIRISNSAPTSSADGVKVASLVAF